MNVKKFATLFCCAVFAISSVSFAQEADTASTENVTAVLTTNAVLNEEGELVGKVFTEVDGEKTPVAAKLTLAKDGVVIKTVEADENGLFAFASVAPGTYNMFGSAESFFGGSTVAVAPFAGTSAPMTLPLTQGGGYDSYSSAPAMSMGGGGTYGGGGSSVLGNRRIRRLALIGGIVAIAVGTASPDGMDN